ncbi:MAG: hypothetical protein HYY18_16345 [Planctomycetes bacterium]|nr:hypothetical protein [Planctomycetota bacterium]
MNRTRSAALLLLALAALPAAADIGPKPRTEAPGIEATGDMAGIDVEMEAEEVALTLRRDRKKKWTDELEVEAVFHMKNPGAEATFEEGFPIGPVKNMRGFSATIDGERVEARLVDRFGGQARPVTEKDADRYDESGRHDYWYVWNASFPAGATRTHAVRYRLRLFSYNLHRSAGYVLETGARWKNPIGRVTVTLRCAGELSTDHVTALGPVAGAVHKGDSVEWTFENLEPTAAHNIEIRYHTGLTWDQLVAETSEEAKIHWSARKELLAMLSAAPARFARERLTAEEADAFAGALAGMLADLRETDGAWVLPAEERQRARFGKGISEEEREEILKTLGNETREYARPGEAARLFDSLEPAANLAREFPGSARAKEALGKWVALGDRFLEGKVRAGGTVLAFPESVRETEDAALRARIEEARAVLR